MAVKATVREVLARALRVPRAPEREPQRAVVSEARPSPAPIPSHHVLAGAPAASSAHLVASHDEGASASLWCCEEGSFRWEYRSDEIIYVLEGEVTVTPDGGEPFPVRSGDVVYFPNGSSAKWEVHKAIRKIAFFRSETADPLGRLRGALSR